MLMGALRLIQYLDQEVKDLAWELYILELWNLHNTERYKVTQKRFYKAANTARKMRGLSPLKTTEYDERRQVLRHKT